MQINSMVHLLMVIYLSSIYQFPYLFNCSDSMPKPAAGGSPNLFSGFEDDLDDNNLFAPRTVPQSIPKLAPRIK